MEPDTAWAVLAADRRSFAESRFSPPGMDWHAPLTDFLVHRLDVTVPLGVPVDPIDAAWAGASR